MGTLRPGLFYPLLQTVTTCQLGTVRTHYGVLNRAEADKTAEELVQFEALLATIISSEGSSYGLDATRTARRGQRWNVVVIGVFISMMSPH